MDERTILRKAKEILVSDGWGQGSGSMAVGARPCLEAAVARASDARVIPYIGENNDLGYEYPIGCAAYETLKTVAGEPSRLYVWNDQRDRTVEEVCDLIDRALGSLLAEALELEKAVVT